MKNGIPTFVKWAGGKKQLLVQFEKFFPEKINRYYEPFVGGGAVAFHIIKKYKPKEAFLSDINEELVNCLNIIKTNVSKLIEELQKLKKIHHELPKDTYYKIRAQQPFTLTDLQRAARFIYLNKTCFNGLYRVNSKGQFNVPMGSYKNPNIVPKDELIEISELLKNTKISVEQFHKIVNKVKKGDFFYFDPPYYPLNGGSFTTYTKDNFLKEDQEKLASVFKELDSKGCKVMLSNSDTDFIKGLYKGYNINFVKATRMINCDASKRGAINEIVVTNY